MEKERGMLILVAYIRFGQTVSPTKTTERLVSYEYA